MSLHSLPFTSNVPSALYPHGDTIQSKCLQFAFDLWSAASILPSVLPPICSPQFAFYTVRLYQLFIRKEQQIFDSQWSRDDLNAVSQFIYVFRLNENMPQVRGQNSLTRWGEQNSQAP